MKQSFVAFCSSQGYSEIVAFYLDSRERLQMKSMLLLLGFLSISSGAIAQVFTYDLPGPPSVGDVQDEIDYQTLLDEQSKRTPAECARAEYEVSVTLQKFFAAPYGPLTITQATKWQKFVNAHSAHVLTAVTAAKIKFHRARPYRTHADIIPCISREASFSYPSGHAVAAEFYGRILAIAFPELKSALAVRATQVALDRSLGGVHYPSDVRDGLLLGDEIFEGDNENGKLETLIHEFFF